MECLGSHDESIRLRALDLIVGMINKRNLMEIVKRLIAHIEESESVRKLSHFHGTFHCNKSVIFVGISLGKGGL